MPLNKDPTGGGTNADGTKSEKYCGHCFQNGEFVCDATTVAEFQEFCRGKMIEGGTPKILAWLFTRGMGRLERWNRRASR
jgi:hypothetical protein